MKLDYLFLPNKTREIKAVKDDGSIYYWCVFLPGAELKASLIYRNLLQEMNDDYANCFEDTADLGAESLIDESGEIRLGS